MTTDEITPFRERLRIAFKWQYNLKTAKYYAEGLWGLPGDLGDALLTLFTALLMVLLMPIRVITYPLQFVISPLWCALTERKERVWGQLRRVVDKPSG